MTIDEAMIDYELLAKVIANKELNEQILMAKSQRESIYEVLAFNQECDDYKENEYTVYDKALCEINDLILDLQILLVKSY